MSNGYAFNMPSYDYSSGTTGGQGMDWLSMAIYASMAILGGMFGGGSENVPEDYAEWVKMQDKQFEIWKGQLDYQLSEGRRNWEWQKGIEMELWKHERAQRMYDIEGSPLKPQTPYYGIERNLPAYDYALSRAIIGNMGEKLGSERMQQYGIDMGELQAGMGMNVPYAQFYKNWAEGQKKFDYPDPGKFMTEERKKKINIDDDDFDPFNGNGDGNGGGGGNGKDDEERKKAYTQWAEVTIAKILGKYGLGKYKEAKEK